MTKTRVKLAVQAEEQDVPCWPHINYDRQAALARILRVLEAENPDAEFETKFYTRAEDAERDYAADEERFDGVLVLMMTCWKGVDAVYCRRAREGLPVVVADVPYCGSGALLTCTVPYIRSERLPVPVLSTLDGRELARAVRLFTVLKRMRETKILVVSNRDWSVLEAAVGKTWGCSFENRNARQFLPLVEKASLSEAQELASKWEREAAGRLEPSREDLVMSAKVHLALKSEMEACGASAVTLDCLNLSYDGSLGIAVYPCLSHFEMLNRGVTAVCEADLDATVTELLVSYLTGQQGYVSDPVVDTSSGQIIYAHCVACARPFGANDPRCCRYYLRSHAEDRKGASVQVIFPAGEKLTTTLCYTARGKAVVHSAVSVGNVGGEEGCRTKLAAAADAEAILRNWYGDWHRVTVFGDCRRELMRLYRMKDFEVIEEDRG